MVKMIDEDLNKRLHEIMGLCWHEWEYAKHAQGMICILCSQIVATYNPKDNIDFVNTWQSFGILWEFIQKHERWEEFMNFALTKQELQHFKNNTYYKYWWYFIVNPPVLAKTVAEFFEEK